MTTTEIDTNPTGIINAEETDDALIMDRDLLNDEIRDALERIRLIRGGMTLRLVDKTADRIALVRQLQRGIAAYRREVAEIELELKKRGIK